jgi:trans-aconitate methyltransferase
MRNHPLCKRAIGVDGAEGMIQNAKEIDSEGDYFFQDLMLWSPKSKVDFIHSMEVLYYFKNPKILISHMLEKWLKPNGRIISGVDYYLENETSHSWPKDLNTQMKLLSIQDWKDLFEKCGLMEVEVFQTNASNSFSGTLIISGINKSI